MILLRFSSLKATASLFLKKEVVDAGFLSLYCFLCLLLVVVGLFRFGGMVNSIEISEISDNISAISGDSIRLIVVITSIHRSNRFTMASKEKEFLVLLHKKSDQNCRGVINPMASVRAVQNLTLA